MNRWFKFLMVAALAVAGQAIAGGGTSTVSANAVKIMGAPSARRSSAQAWEASTAYSQGELVSSATARYLALVAGTSGSTGPSGTGDQSDGTVTWRHVTGAPRQGLFLANEGGVRVTVRFDGSVTAGAGITLGAGEKIVLTGRDAPQTAIYVIADSGSDSFSAYEW